MENSKKKLLIFILIAYGLTYLMAIPMYFGLKADIDLSVFPVAQMFYPACGVIVGKLIYDSKEMLLPKGAYICTLVAAIASVIFSILSVVAPVANLEVNGQSIGVYYLISNYILIATCIVAYILLWTCGKEKRINSGMERNKIGLSIAVVALYVALYFVRIAIAYGIDGVQSGEGLKAIADWATIFTDVTTWIGFITVIINFFFSFLLFFGEEYGWRYYLQPIMMNKFGKRGGVLLLGLVWAVWHLPLDFMYYTTTTGPQIFVNQIFTCLGIGTFMAWAYMKTNNFWVPLTIHYINNNLIPVITGTNGTEAFQNQELAWSQLPITAALMLVFFVFILSKEFNKEKAEASK